MAAVKLITVQSVKPSQPVIKVYVRLDPLPPLHYASSSLAASL